LGQNLDGQSGEWSAERLVLLMARGLGRQSVRRWEKSAHC
jgi:hypothetical protein